MNFVQKLLVRCVKFIGSITWKYKNGLTTDEKDIIRQTLSKNYCIILTRSNNHLSTYAISISNFLIGAGWGYWGHALLNMEDGDDEDVVFELIESTAAGVHLDTFDDVFAVHSVALLKPKNVPAEYWTKIFAQAIADIGKPYDNLFNINDDTYSCVELVRHALQADPAYATNFANFEAMVQKHKRITPDMFYKCPDFEVVYEVRH